MSLNYTIFWHAQNQKNTIISNIESFHFFLSLFWFKILNFDINVNLKMYSFDHLRMYNFDHIDTCCSRW